MMLRKVLGKGSVQVVVLLVMALNLIPLIIAFSTSLRDPSNNTNPLILFREMSFASYKAAFDRMHFPEALWNSVVLTLRYRSCSLSCLRRWRPTRWPV